MPKVSVIVPIYNIASYLEECVRSVLAQTFPDFELLLIDDGSKDGSGRIADGFAAHDHRVRVFHKTNGGLSDARNYGLKRAVGEYVQFIDGDDFIAPTLLEKCAARLDETGADLVIFDFFQYYSATQTREEIRNSYSDARTYVLSENKALMTRIANAAWNKMYRRSLFSTTGILFPKGYYYEDLGTTYRLLAMAKEIAFVNAPLYNYRKDRPGNITGDFNEKVMHILDMAQLLVSFYKQNDLYAQYRQELMYVGCTNIMECLKKTRDAQDHALAFAFVDRAFAYIKTTWPHFPWCHYALYKEKYDWIYMNHALLRLYLTFRYRREERRNRNERSHDSRTDL